MLRRLAFTGLAALAAGWLAACASATTPDAGSVHELDRHNAFLYEVSRPGSSRVDLYVLGSVHVLDVPLVLGGGLRESFESADALVLELDTRKLDPEAATELVVRYGLLDPGQQLEHVLSPETLALLLARLDQPDFTPDERLGVLRLQPWAISMLLLDKQAVAAGAEAGYGVDVFFAESLPHGTPILELETPDEQILAMASLSPRQSDAMLRQSLESETAQREHGVDELALLLDAWKSGDEEALVAVLFGSAEQGNSLSSHENVEMYETIFIARNERMSLGLQDLLEEDPERVLFAVVGAGHVVGAESIPELLRAEGFRVERAR